MSYDTRRGAPSYPGVHRGLRAQELDTYMPLSQLFAISYGVARHSHREVATYDLAWLPGAVSCDAGGGQLTAPVRGLQHAVSCVLQAQAR